MLSGEQKRRIRERLVYLYHDKKDHIEIIAEDIELNVSNLSSDDITVCCRRICNEAERQGKLVKLIERVFKEYFQDEELPELLEIVKKVEGTKKTGDLKSNPLPPLEQEPKHIQEPSGQTPKPVQPVQKQEPVVSSETSDSAAQPASGKQTKKLIDVLALARPKRIFSFRPEYTAFILLIVLVIISILYFIQNTSIFLFSITIVITATILFLCAYNRFFAKEQIALRQHSLTGVFSWAKWCNIIVLVVVIISTALNVFSAINGFSIPVSPIGLHNVDGATVGVCDGICSFDSYRLDSNLKQEATNAFNQNNQNLACQDLRWAAIGNIQPGTAEQAGKQDDARSIALDSTDAEAKIYYADRCANIPCPCVSYVAAVQLVDPTDIQYTDNADYINGVSRGILQGAYVKQNEWNTSHPQGPGMYIFIANIVAGDPNLADWKQTQDTVAQHIQDLQMNDQTHRILGVIGLPFGSRELETKLNAAGIPMVSTTPLSRDDTTQWPYLFSVVPSLQEEIQGILDYCNEPNFNKILYIYDSEEGYSNLFKSIWDSLINSNQKYASLTKKIIPMHDSISIGQPPGQPNESIPTQAASSGADLIVFTGPMNRTVHFLTQLRNTEKNLHIPEHEVLSDDNAYQWVYKYFSPDPEDRASRAAFDQFFFPSFAYPDLSAITSHPNDPYMLSDFNSLFDPTSKHSGNIYTHQRASSDAILAYDALSVLVTAEDNLSKAGPTSLDALQKSISSHTFPGVSGQITYKNGNVPDQKIVLLISVVQQNNAVQQPLSGQY